MHNIFISCKESRIENNRSFYGCFNIGPFDSAQSLTIGNALRRTLLSECPGLGITSVMIDKVSHEYRTLPGMRESVLDLLLNLKEIVFTVTPLSNFNASSEQRTSTQHNTSVAVDIRKKNLLVNNMSSIFSEDFNLAKNSANTKLLLNSKETLNLLISKRKQLKKPLIGYLKVKGPGIIRARDLKLPPFIQCVDANQYIATLAEDGFLSMKFILMEGKGYIVQKNQSVIKSTLEGQENTQSLPAQLITRRFAWLLGESQGADFVNPVEKNVNANTIQKQNNQSTSNFSNSGGNTNNKTPLPKKMINSTYTTEFVNSRSLNLDCVFNPVTKVSYIIEDFDNKLINDFNYGFNFANDVSSLMESSYYLQNLNLFNKQNEKTQFDKAQASTNHTIFSQNIVNLVNSYSKDEMQELVNYLTNGSRMHTPLKKSKEPALHNITLEIWTNGGIHPREALTIAFQNLSSLFLNLNKL